jgi:hypothetical protein
VRLLEEKTRIEREYQTSVVLAAWQRYQPMLEMAVTQLLSLSIEKGQYLARATYLLETLCPSAGLRTATRLHAIDLDVIPHYSGQIATGIFLDDVSVSASLQKLVAAVPARDQENFWLALAAVWIQSVPLKTGVLEGEGIDSEALLEDAPRFRDYLRSELMQRLTHMY